MGLKKYNPLILGNENRYSSIVLSEQKRYAYGEMFTDYLFNECKLNEDKEISKSFWDKNIEPKYNKLVTGFISTMGKLIPDEIAPMTNYLMNDVKTELKTRMVA